MQFLAHVFIIFFATLFVLCSIGCGHETYENEFVIIGLHEKNNPVQRMLFLTALEEHHERISPSSRTHQSIYGLESHTHKHRHTRLRLRHTQPMSLSGLSSAPAVELGIERARINEYLGILHVGEPGQPLKVVFDTGSSALIISSMLCKQKSCRKERNRFDLSKSRTFKKGTSGITVVYGSGKLSGPTGYDRVCIQSICVNKQVFGLIKYESGKVFETGIMDGVVGMSLPQLSWFHRKKSKRMRPLIDHIDRENKLPGHMFAFFYSRRKDVGSRLIFGTPPSNLYRGGLTWHKVVNPGFWNLPLDDIRIGKKSLKLRSSQISSKSSYALIDSGTSAISAPTKVVKPILEAIEAGQKDKSFPTLIFVIEGHEYILDPEDYIICSGIFFNMKCKPAILGIDVEGGSAFILGDIFLKKYFSVFDYKNACVGMALANQGYRKEAILEQSDES